MKSGKIAFVFIVFLLSGSCREGSFGTSYQPVLPELPSHWVEILGEPHWRLEWIGEGGFWQEREIPPSSGVKRLSLISEWTTPVLAWPYWPSRDLHPGTMRPAGALFPWDASGDKLKVHWQGGIDAFMWKELSLAERSTEASLGRLPWYFDWPRFRELLESDNIPEAVRDDPWLADWKDIARRTVQSGFDRRRITLQGYSELVITGLEGLWIGSSPFAQPLDAAADGSLRISVKDTPDTWASSGGILKASTSGWVLRPF